MTHIGKYKLEAEIGRGGFGLVYKAYDPEVGRPVAIKVLTGEDNKDLLVRFKREANAAGKLKHKNILTIYGYGEHENSPYLVMEYLEGENLETLLASGNQFSLLQKTSIMSQVAEGLHHAHQNGVVHRDIKPANIRILPDGSVKIMDFGIARVLNEHSSRLTRQGDLIGTLAYMAPEVFQEGDVDELCDIFSFGVVYYQLVAGKNPFASEGPARVIYNLTTVQPPFLSTLAPDCPPALEQLIARAIHKERELRYQSFEDLMFDLMPIYSQLQGTEVEGLLEQVQPLIDAKRLDEARAIVRQALQFSPHNVSARKLREQINREIQRETNSRKCEELLSTGQGHLGSGEYSKAVEAFETVLRIDTEHAKAQSLLQETQAAIKKRDRAQTLIVQAERELNAGRLTEAYRSILECIQYAPNNEKADALLETIRIAIRVRERQRHFDESLSKVRELISSSRLGEAEDLLSELQSTYPATSEVTQLISEVRTALDEQRQRQRIQEGVARAENALSEKRWDEVLSLLDPLTREFPREKELQALLSRARAGLDAQRKAERIQEIVRDVQSANALEDYERSLELLERGLATYPNDPELSPILESTRSLQTQAQRKSAVRTAIEKAEALSAQKKYSAALDEIDLAAGLWESGELREFRKRIETQSREYQRQQAVSAACAAVQAYVDKGLLQEAVREGRTALGKFPGDAALLRLVEQAESSLADRERRKLIDTIHEKATTRAAQNDFAGALRILRDALQQHDDPSLRVLYESIEADQDRQNRRTGIAKGVAEIQQLLGKAEYSEALEACNRALKEFPGEASLKELLDATKRSLHEKQLKERLGTVDKKVRSLLASKNLPAARSLLQDTLREVGKGTLLDDLAALIDISQREEEKAENVQKAMDQAAAMMKSKQYPEAVTLLEGTLSRYPSEAATESLLREARELLDAQSRSEHIAEVIAQARQAMDARNYQGALKIVRAAVEKYPLDEFPEENELAAILAEIKAVMANLEKGRAIRAALDSAASFEEQGEFEKAVRVLELALEKDPSEPRILEQRERLNQRMARQKQVNAAVDKVCELMARAMFDEALESCQNAMKVYPDELAFPQLLEDIRTSRQADASAKACRSIESLLASGQMDKAADRMDEALGSFSGDPKVQSLKLRVETELERRETARYLEALKAEAHRLLDHQQPESAIAKLQPALRDFPDDLELKDLLANANEIIAARQREGELRSITTRAKSLLDKGSAAEALSVLNGALSQFPDNPGLMKLLQRAKKDSAVAEERERTQKVSSALARARSETQAGRPAPAIKALEATLAEVPGSPELISEMDRIRAAHPELVEKRGLNLKIAGIAAAVLLLVAVSVGVAIKFLGGKEGDAPPPPPPPLAKLARIVAFAVTPEALELGAKAQLCYTVEDATSVALEPATSEATGSGAQKCVEVAPTDTTEYRLTAKNAEGLETTETRVITVNRPVEQLGTLVINTSQTGAEIRIDNRPPQNLGNERTIEVKLTPGPHTIVVAKEGFEDAEDKAQVAVATKTTLNLPLKKEEPVSLEESVAEANKTYGPAPPYPAAARPARLQGSVVLSVAINKDGSVKDVTRISGNVILGNAALDAVRQWRYRPHLVKGKPVEVLTRVTVNFVAPPEPDVDNTLPPRGGGTTTITVQPVNPCVARYNSVNKNNANDLETFIGSADCRLSPQANEARERLNSLRADEERNAWIAANNPATIESLTAYLNRFGANAPNAAAARNQIARLDAEAKDRAANARRQADIEAVKSTLSQYSQAYRSKNTDRLKALFSGFDEARFRRDWPAAVTISRYDIEPAEPAFPDANRATVLCRVVNEYRAPGQRPEIYNDNLLFTLRRQGTGWVIESTAKR